MNGSPSSSSSNKGLKIGLGVGIPLGFIVLALVGFLLFRLTRQKKEIKELRNHGHMHVGFMGREHEEQEMDRFAGSGAQHGSYAGDVLTQPQAVAQPDFNPNPGAWNSGYPGKKG